MGDADNAAQTPSADDEEQSATLPAGEPEPQPSTAPDGDGGEVKPATTYEG